VHTIIASSKKHEQYFEKVNGTHLAHNLPPTSTDACMVEMRDETHDHETTPPLCHDEISSDLHREMSAMARAIVNGTRDSGCFGHLSPFSVR
jgi:hypothetical protein